MWKWHCVLHIFIAPHDYETKEERFLIPIHNMCLCVMNTIRFCASNRLFYFCVYNLFNVFSLYSYSRNTKRKKWIRINPNQHTIVFQQQQKTPVKIHECESVFESFYTTQTVMWFKCKALFCHFNLLQKKFFTDFFLFVASSLTVARLLATISKLEALRTFEAFMIYLIEIFENELQNVSFFPEISHCATTANECLRYIRIIWFSRLLNLFCCIAVCKAKFIWVLSFDCAAGPSAPM